MPKLNTPARVASVLTAIGVIAAGIAPIIASLDVKSTASIMGGAVGLLVVLQTFLVGQRAHEARQATTATLASPIYVGTGTNSAGAGYIASNLGTAIPMAGSPPVSDAVEFAKPPDSAITPDPPAPMPPATPLTLTDVTAGDLQTLANQRAAAPTVPPPA